MTHEYPILEVVPDIKERLALHQAVVLQAPPGAGKSTVLPWMLLHEPWLEGKKIIMLEPRRLAAKSVATRMAFMLKEKIGETIGYRVRFEQSVGQQTRCEVVTEGILTRMIQDDNSLESAGLVIFDEFHERSLHADLALSMCLQVQQILRPDLKILVMSATLDTENISSILKGAPTISSTGRQYKVKINYATPQKDSQLTSSVSKLILKCLAAHPGDLLVFLPGAAEINKTHSILSEQGIDATIYPLYGNLSFAKQQEAIVPRTDGGRKIVLSTSIAETSLTIEGITTVIDGGYARVPKFDPRSGMTRLETVRVTRDSADQRAGRAGRLGPGVCYRLWSETSNHTLQPRRQPEILEADLASMVLELSNWGIHDINQLSWITPPPVGALSQARDLLHQLGAIRENQITSRGKEMLRLPTHPRIAHMLLSARARVGLAIDIAALLEERDPLDKSSGADMALRVDSLRKWRLGQRVSSDHVLLKRIEKLAASWRSLFHVKAENTNVLPYEAGVLVAEAYPERIAMQLEKNGPRFKLANGRVVKLMDYDPLVREPWLAIALVDVGIGEGRIFLAAAIDERDLMHRAIDYDSVTWDSSRGMIVAVKEKRIHNVILHSQPLLNISEEQRIRILCQAVRDEGIHIMNRTDVHDSWQARVMCLRLWRKDESWPDVSEENLLATVDEWLGPYLTSVSRKQDFAKLDLTQILNGLLPYELANKIDVLTPARLQVPSGSLVKLQYKADGSPPVLEVRLQEVFGLLETPAINEGRTKVLLHLLSPGYKPVQVTQDLKSFWKSAYHEVRKEMRMRYPRHFWPEDPWTAEAVRGVKKKL